MVGFLRVGRMDKFAEGRPKNLSFNGLEIVVVRVDGTVHAFENNCPHQHFSQLHQGVVEGCSITCPVHGWTFDLKSGQSTNGNGKLRSFEVKAGDGFIWIRMDEHNREYSLFE